MTKPKPPTPLRYSVGQLAKRWGCDADQVQLYRLDGLDVQTVEAGGKRIECIAWAEVMRFEGLRKAPRAADNPTQLISALLLVRDLMHFSMGDDPIKDHPYRFYSEQLSPVLAAAGLGIGRSDDTYAALIGRAMAMRETYAPRERDEERARDSRTSGAPAKLRAARGKTLSVSGGAD